MATRRRVPAEIRYEVTFEAAHRCAVCCERSALEVAHIIPWSKVKEHTADNLILLCATCHTIADKEKWAPAYFRKYKTLPCGRAHQTVDRPKEPRVQITLSLPGRIEDFSSTKRKDLASALASAVDLVTDEVTIIKIEQGSVKVTVELPASYAEKLLVAYEANDLQLTQLINLSDSVEVADPFESAVRTGSLDWQHILLLGVALIVLIAVGAMLGVSIYTLLGGGAAGTHLAEIRPAVQSTYSANDNAIVGVTDGVAWTSLATILAAIAVGPGLLLYYTGCAAKYQRFVSSFIVLMTISVAIPVWCIVGYSMAFTEGGAFIGNFGRLFLHGTFDDTARTFSLAPTLAPGIRVPELLFVAYQAIVATFSCCLMITELAPRIRFSSAIFIVILWLTLSYAPLAHMVWYSPGTEDGGASGASNSGGLLWNWGVIDFGGGLVTHVNAGIGALIGAIFLGNRVGYGKEVSGPYSIVLAGLGAMLMWVGWLGFTLGASLKGPDLVGLAFVNSLLAPSVATFSWVMAEWIAKGRPSVLGAMTGLIAGLIAITPGAGVVGVGGSLCIGLISGVVCFWSCVWLRHKLGPSMADTFCLHGIAGILGTLLTGIFNINVMGGVEVTRNLMTPMTNSDSVWSQLRIQASGVLFTVIWSATVAVAIFATVNLVLGLGVADEDGEEFMESGGFASPDRSDDR